MSIHLLMMRSLNVLFRLLIAIDSNGTIGTCICCRAEHSNAKGKTNRSSFIT